MKLAIAIASEKAIPETFVVWRGFEASVHKAREAGYHGVELALRSEKEFCDENLAAILKKENMRVSCVSTGQVFATDGLCFTHESAEVRKKTIETFKGLINVAGDFGGLVNIGRARGSIWGSRTKEETEAIFLDGLNELVPTLESNNVSIVIEPVNRYEINYLNNTDQVCDLLRKMGCKHFGVMPDVFHMNIEDDNICSSLERNAEYIKYVHFADSNRHYPGQGHLDFASFVNTLNKVGYNGWCTVEILPIPDPDTAGFEASKYLLPLFES